MEPTMPGTASHSSPAAIVSRLSFLPVPLRKRSSHGSPSRGAILATVVLAASVLCGCGATKEAPAIRRPAPLVATAVSRTGSLPEYVVVSGRVRALERATVGARITGRVRRVDVREGDAVVAGQAVIWLDDRDLRAQEGEAAAALQAARSRVAQLETGTDLSVTEVSVGIARARQAVLQAQSQMNREQANYDDALIDLHRKEDLFRQDAIPQITLEAARLRFRQASQQMRTDRAMVATAGEGVRLARANVSQTRMQEDQVRAARAAVGQAEATLEAARVSLGYTVLLAPISGVVTARDVDPGQAVNAQQSRPLLTIVDNTRLETVIPVDERFAPALSHHEPVQVSTDVRGVGRLSAFVHKVVPFSDVTSHTVMVRISIHEPERKLLDGMYVTARLKVRAYTGSLVPMTAVQRREGEDFVMLLRGQHVEKRRVQVAFQDGHMAVLSAGLGAGEPVVSVGAEGLKDKQEVRVAPPGSGAPPSGSLPVSIARAWPGPDGSPSPERMPPSAPSGEK